jgi:small multidrug resistance pump
MGFLMLLTAIAAEVGGTTAMKFSHGFSRLWPSVLTVLGYARLLRAARADAEVHVGRYGLRDLGGLGTAAIVGIGTVFLGEG